MANCPSAVASARTVARRTTDGIDLVITAADSRARAAILARSELQDGMGEPLWFLPAHTGTHAGPGTIGRCPIIHTSTFVDHDRTADGVIVHVRAREPAQVEQLQSATEARLRALQAPAS